MIQNIRLITNILPVDSTAFPPNLLCGLRWDLFFPADGGGGLNLTNRIANDRLFPFAEVSPASAFLPGGFLCGCTWEPPVPVSIFIILRR